MAWLFGPILMNGLLDDEIFVFVLIDGLDINWQ